MEKDESIDEMFNRFTMIINDLKSMVKTYNTQDQIRNILKSYLKVWRHKATLAYEAKYLARLQLDELLGSLKVHE